MTIIAIKNNGIPESASTNLGIKCSYLKAVISYSNRLYCFILYLTILSWWVSKSLVYTFIFTFIILLLLNDKPQAVRLFRAPSQLNLTYSSVFRFMFASETPIVTAIVTHHSVFHLYIINYFVKNPYFGDPKKSHCLSHTIR